MRGCTGTQVPATGTLVPRSPLTWTGSATHYSPLAQAAPFVPSRLQPPSWPQALSADLSRRPPTPHGTRSRTEKRARQIAGRALVGRSVEEQGGGGWG